MSSLSYQTDLVAGLETQGNHPWKDNMQSSEGLFANHSQDLLKGSPMEGIRKSKISS